MALNGPPTLTVRYNLGLATLHFASYSDALLCLSSATSMLVSLQQQLELSHQRKDGSRG